MAKRLKLKFRKFWGLVRTLLDVTGEKLVGGGAFCPAPTSIVNKVNSGVLHLADVSKNFRKMCLEIYKLDHLKFISAPGLAWQTALKKTEVKLELLTDVDFLLIVEKGIRGGICHAIHRNAKANRK